MYFFVAIPPMALRRSRIGAGERMELGQSKPATEPFDPDYSEEENRRGRRRLKARWPRNDFEDLEWSDSAGEDEDDESCETSRALGDDRPDVPVESSRATIWKHTINENGLELKDRILGTPSAFLAEEVKESPQVVPATGDPLHRPSPKDSPGHLFASAGELAQDKRDHHVFVPSSYDGATKIDFDFAAILRTEGLPTSAENEDENQDMLLESIPALREAMEKNLEMAFTQVELACAEFSQVGLHVKSTNSSTRSLRRKRQSQDADDDRAQPPRKLLHHQEESIESFASFPSGRGQLANKDNVLMRNQGVAAPGGVDTVPQIMFRNSSNWQPSMARPTPLASLKPDSKALRSFIGTIMQINPMDTWTRPGDANPVDFRSFSVGDASQQFFVVTLWGPKVRWLADEGQTDRFRIGDVVLFDNIKIRSYRQRRHERISASTVYTTAAALLYRYSFADNRYIEVNGLSLPTSVAQIARQVMEFATNDQFLEAARTAFKNGEDAMRKPLPISAGRGTLEEIFDGTTNELVSGANTGLYHMLVFRALTLCKCEALLCHWHHGIDDQPAKSRIWIPSYSSFWGPIDLPRSTGLERDVRISGLLRPSIAICRHGSPQVY